MIDGIPDVTGLKTAAESKRPARVREPAWYKLNNPSNPQFAQIKAILEELVLKEEELRAEKKELELEASVLIICFVRFV